MDIFINIFNSAQLFINQWWPWISFWDDVFFIQFFIVCTFFYIYVYKNVYYVLLYTFINFFLIGVYLSVFQIELFTAFLWLVECSVLFVFLLLLFFLNIKGSYTYTSSQTYNFFFFNSSFFLLPFSELLFRFRLSLFNRFEFLWYVR